MGVTLVAITGMPYINSVDMNFCFSSDINADGYPDIIIGDGANLFQRGIGYILYGKASLTNINIASLTGSQGVIIRGVNSVDYTGAAISSVGDINGDGYPDIVMGAYGYSSNTGRTYVILDTSAAGAPSLNPTIAPSTPTFSPSIAPTIMPSLNPSRAPSSVPSPMPTLLPTTPLQKGLVAYFPFNGNANDDSGNGRITTIIGATLTSDRFGVANRAYYFDGADYIKITDGTAFDFSNSLSVSFWVKPTSASQDEYSTLLSKSHKGYPASSSASWAIEQASTQNNCIWFIYRQSTNPDDWIPASRGSIHFNQNEWHHFLIIKEDNVMKSYYDGNLQETYNAGSTYIKTNGDLPLYIGATYYNGNYIRFFKGCLDDIRVYDRALITSEVQQLYTEDPPTLTPTASPSAAPTSAPTNQPTAQPILTPSVVPTFMPSVAPTANPSTVPTCPPTAFPTITPSVAPTHKPTMIARDLKNINLGTLSAAQGFSFSCGGLFNYYGWSVSGIGDINNDGYDDVIVGGLHGYNIAGMSYVILGKSSGFVNGCHYSFSIAPSDPSATYNGYSVNGAGDVNGDGYADIIIGEPNAYSSKGVSHIIFGKANNFVNIDLSSITSSQGFSITGANTGDRSGISVSGLGDVNGDGYSDVIIGAYYAVSGTGIRGMTINGTKSYAKEFYLEFYII